MLKALLKVLSAAAALHSPKVAMLDQRIKTYEQTLTWTNLTSVQRTYVAQRHAHLLYKRYRLLEEFD